MLSSVPNCSTQNGFPKSNQQFLSAQHAVGFVLLLGRGSSEHNGAGLLPQVAGGRPCARACVCCCAGTRTRVQRVLWRMKKQSQPDRPCLTPAISSSDRRSEGGIIIVSASG